jgi:UPF0755 protein
MRKRRLLVLSVLLIVVLGIGYENRASVRNILDQVTGADFAGGGHGSVTLVIHPGDTGSDVANALVKADVVKSFHIVYGLLIARNQTFYPGSYSLRHEMSSLSALTALADSHNRINELVVIKEGYRLSNTFSALSAATNISVDEFKQTASNLSSIGVPAGEVSAEGWLFPATYSFDPSQNPTEILSAMVDRTKQELNRYSVPQASWHRVLTLASVVQKEGRQTPDFYKISRVFLNRIAAGMNLQSDATVSYGVSGNTVSTSAADRANTNGYNTYIHPGLPIGPISAPGSVAIDAALHPAVGKWLYFCAVNLATGETVFSETYAQHEVAVRQWQAWMRANPGYGG